MWYNVFRCVRLCCAGGVMCLCLDKKIVKCFVLTVSKPVLNLVYLTFLSHAQVTEAAVATALKDNLLLIYVPCAGVVF